ncbi:MULTISPECIES: type VI secretion system Vgr family protein [unclassified Herbaspirillum]|uniref:type VI secretion system Vgr family protein n=1 Tax=unclassified Herbaspirillum TaxID=2624150 RepID=UPI000E2EA243|nr:MULTISPECIES: type VI secretion system Vgr family protein [unclassified Herbaspirillum]RFB73235.1 type VI secretion system tip protein VgrG [Herbaspirillum sp. 3R-3a1]TFI10955.1 type VI secretion system tip protein VgrG [Herbaspirillum sp. 3R11]TFI16862.1 type VI secretion system tip protein VgrG [Herbaspirillum sp. 3R-11]TFI30509.1 type VI secretion system tip protein VgrG [Herbaspirillum sp. 3C11]
MALLTQSRALSASSTAIPEIMGQPALVPVKLSGTEGLNGLFEYHLDLKTPDGLNLIPSHAANFKLNDFIGRELTVKIELEGNGSFISGVAGGSSVNSGAGIREITGLITDAALLGESGRFVHYQLALRPWLHLATENNDCRIYQDKTVVEILDALLGKYSFPVDKRFIDTYPKRDYQTQFNESDYHFFCRLCEEWGINWFFEHSDGKHRLVLIDNMGAHKKNPSAAYQQIPFYPEGHKIDAEYVHRFTPTERITSGSYVTRDYDYTRPKADLTVKRSDPRPTAHNQQEVYEWHADAHYSQPKAGVDKDGNDSAEESKFIARMRMESLRQRGHHAQGSGHLRGIVPGCTFALQKHPQHAANTDYLIISTSLLIEEVAQASQSPGAAVTNALNPLAQSYKVELDFDVHLLKEQCRPERRTLKPFTRGPQTALVVGPEDQNIWTDQYGRIKVQFPWDRLGQNNQNSSCWVRVSSPWAGNQLGGIQLPRIGQEVIVDFIGGDPDLPICTGRVHNQSNLPPWSLPGQSALSGFRSRELTKDGGNATGGRSNHLILDDTEQKIQAQLKSDHLHSQLSLGHITRIEDNQGRKDARGEGFELRTDGAGALRAVEGILLSTNARLKAAGTINDYTEIIADLEQALAIAKQLDPDDYVPHSAAQDIQPQQDLTQAVTAQHDNGQGKQSGGQRVIAISSPAGIASATPKDQLHYAGRNIDTVAGNNQQHYAMGDILHTAGNSIHEFAHDGDIRNIANKGKVVLQAQHNSMELTADDSLTMTSTEDGIVFQAKDYIMLRSGQSFLKVTEQDITVDARTINVQSDWPHISPAKGGTAAIPEFSQQKVCIPCLLSAIKTGAPFSKSL